MVSVYRPWLILALCLVTVLNGVAMASSAPAAAPQAPCDTSSGHDGHPSGGEGDDPGAACAQQCALLCAGFLLAHPKLSAGFDAYPDRVATGAAAFFQSQAGPPGLQPPR
jgi:hypothetical protein